MGVSKRDSLRVDFDRRLKLEFHGSKITSDAGLLTYRELDDALGLTEVAGDIFQDSRNGKNGWHGMTGQFRQLVVGRLGGYEDVNDADRPRRDPAMRWIVGGKAVERQATSTSQMERFEKASTPSSGRGCHAASSAITRCSPSFTPWPTIWATSCGRLRCQRRWITDR